jgi:hypothetical protein
MVDEECCYPKRPCEYCKNTIYEMAFEYDGIYPLCSEACVTGTINELLHEFSEGKEGVRDIED